MAAARGPSPLPRRTHRRRRKCCRSPRRESAESWAFLPPRFHFVRSEEELMPRLPQSAEVLPRVGIDRDCEINAALEVLLQRLDGRALAGQGNVQNIRSALGAKADAVADPQFERPDVNALERLPLGGRFPVAGPIHRIIPWRSNSRSASSEVVRSRSCRARSSVAATW